MLSPKLHIKELSNSLVVTDVTGRVSPHGYCMSTATATNTTSALLIVKIPEGRSYTFNVTGSLGMDQGEWQILPWDIGQNDNITSGLYKFFYEVHYTPLLTPNNPVVAKFETEYTALNAVSCCVDKGRSSVLNVPFDRVFKDEKSRKVAELSELLSRAKYARDDCGNMVQAARIAEYLKLNCNCCH
jgi:hypothetical protein